MAKVVTTVSEEGHLYYYEVDDVVADTIALGTGPSFQEFETLDGFRVGLNRDVLASIVIGATRYVKSSGQVSSPPV
ncbi:hypothetical protein LCGC14_2240490, partial [marine sediment metagenome]